VWLRYTGQEYSIFVDESFSMFFELDARGYFCYGACGIPTAEYPVVIAALAPVLQEYRELLVSELRELKHQEFRRISFDRRVGLASDIHDVLKAHGAFLAGFYTPTEAFILERIRVDVMDDLLSVPSDYRAIREKL